jgi:hypothetical protein
MIGVTSGHFNAVFDTPNSRCLRHRNHTPSKVSPSISSASDLQIGHVAIAITYCGAANNYTLVQAERLSLIWPLADIPKMPPACDTPNELSGVVQHRRQNSQTRRKGPYQRKMTDPAIG